MGPKLVLMSTVMAELKMKVVVSDDLVISFTSLAFFPFVCAPFVYFFFCLFFFVYFFLWICLLILKVVFYFGWCHLLCYCACFNCFQVVAI